MPLTSVTIDADLLTAKKLVDLYNGLEASNVRVANYIIAQLTAQPDGGAAVLEAMGKETASQLLERVKAISQTLNDVAATTIDIGVIDTTGTKVPK